MEWIFTKSWLIFKKYKYFKINNCIKEWGSILINKYLNTKKNKIKYKKMLHSLRLIYLNWLILKFIFLQKDKMISGNNILNKLMVNNLILSFRAWSISSVITDILL